MMSARTLFVAWQGQAPSHAWFPVGLLDADVEHQLYRFRYTAGAKRALKDAGFRPLIEFPDLYADYQSAELFPLFQNRIMNRSRADFSDYLRSLDLGEDADPIAILTANGGRKTTDSYEVFPPIEKQPDGSSTCRFFLHRWQRTNKEAQARVGHLHQDEALYVTLELTNPATGLAIQLQTRDYYMIGWAPRYLVHDLAPAIIESPEPYEARVVRINPQPAPSTQRVLIEIRGYWGAHQPMSGSDFRPLVP